MNTPSDLQSGILGWKNAIQFNWSDTEFIPEKMIGDAFIE
jgi:hypothetical protein